MGMAELITDLQNRGLTTGEILEILLFVGHHGMYKFTCCHRRHFNVHQCPVNRHYWVVLT